MKTAVEWLETRAEEREQNNPNESAYWHLRELIKDFEQAKETQKLTMINALVEFSIEAFDIHTESAILNITRRAEKYYNETFKQQEQ
jgi:tRNA(His) 5'-end guanylyltransferase